ncbi:16S rRNA methyltransferase [Candidatus Magnetobacterium bavaricum]|uniref:16S rRNA (uracil(1498)-N(3))-methyltransferase n=1 Tax=Candidatus Magnetobacterium bavaricum TaxID=29290 RepID=A0A0F3H3B5_9BACT|nr:16S rRNA methyltransferase [Candidatus Magnetobacterium bavaricum]
MAYIFVDTLVIKDGLVQLGKEASHYVVSVLRHGSGDEVELFDAGGRYYRGVITTIGRGGVTVRAVQEAAPQSESPLDLVLCQGLLKGDKMDLVVEKSTELGVGRIIPLLTQRGQIHYTRRLDRWKKIAIEAARQSGRVVVPDIAQVMNMSSLLELIASDQERPGATKNQVRPEATKNQVRPGATKNQVRPGATKKKNAQGIMFYEGEATSPLRSVPNMGRVYVLIGSEGGFTREEVLKAEAKGVLITSLGKRILRAETAAIAGVTIVQFLYGDLGAEVPPYEGVRGAYEWSGSEGGGELFP